MYTSKVVQDDLIRVVKSLITDKILWNVLCQFSYRKSAILPDKENSIRIYPCRGKWVIREFESTFENKTIYWIYSTVCKPRRNLHPDEVIFLLKDKVLMQAPDPVEDFLEAYLELIDTLAENEDSF